MAHNNLHTFTLSVIGDKTKEKWVGDFTSKVFLSGRDECVRDNFRREKLGFNPQHADVLSANLANMVSELQVRLTKAPKWWTESDSGFDLLDDNVLREVYTLVMAAEKAAFDAIKKAGEEAQAQLKTPQE